MFSTKNVSSTIAEKAKPESVPRSRSGHSASKFQQPAELNPNWRVLSMHTGTVQPKLHVGAPNDEYEQEADAVAEQVQRSLSEPGLEQYIQTQLQHKPNRLIQRMCACHATDQISASNKSVAKSSNDDHSAALRHAVYSPTAGSPMSDGMREKIEPVLGAGLSAVRIHDDTLSRQAAQSINARAFTHSNHIYLGSGQSVSNIQLMAHEATHTVQQSNKVHTNSSAQAPYIQRSACSHDGRPANCKANAGKLNFAGEVSTSRGDTKNPAIDVLILDAMNRGYGGRWLTQVQTPPNKLKGGKKRGFVDGIKVEIGDEFNAEVVEVKSRSDQGGGCKKASEEVDEYVKDLDRLNPRLVAISRAAFALGGLSGKFSKERPELQKEGIDLGRNDDAYAYSFYLSVQNQFKPITRSAYKRFHFTPNTDGEANKSNTAISAPIDCPGNKQGTFKLDFQTNNRGGISYGCQSDCSGKEQEQKEKPKQPNEEQKRLQHGLTKAAEALSRTEGDIKNGESGHIVQMALINSPSYIGFWGFWISELFNEMPPLSIWDEGHFAIERGKAAITRGNLEHALAHLIKARREYNLASGKFSAWKEDLPGAGTKMQVAIGAAAVAAIAAFVAPQSIAAIQAKLGASATAASSISATEATTLRVAEVIARYDTAAAVAEAASVEAEIVAAAELEAELYLLLLTL